MLFKVLLLFLVLLVLSVDAVKYERMMSGGPHGIKEEYMSTVLSWGTNVTNYLTQQARNETLQSWSMHEDIDQGGSLISIQVNYTPMNLVHLDLLTNTVVWMASHNIHSWIQDMAKGPAFLSKRHGVYGVEIWTDDRCLIALIEFKMETIQGPTNSQTTTTTKTTTIDSSNSTKTSSKSKSLKSTTINQTSRTTKVSPTSKSTTATKLDKTSTSKLSEVTPRSHTSNTKSATKPPQSSSSASSIKRRLQSSDIGNAVNSLQTIKLTSTTKPPSQTPIATSTTNLLQKRATARGGFPPLAYVKNVSFNSSIHINSVPSDTCSGANLSGMGTCRGADTLLPGLGMAIGQGLFSQRGAQLLVQDDGDLCLWYYKPTTEMYWCWKHGVNFEGKKIKVIVSNDGRICIKSRKEDGSDMVEMCTTNEPGPNDGRYRLTLQNDGNLILARGVNERLMFQSSSDVLPYTGPEPCKANEYY
ncbi:hypothetical protein BGZ76_003555 [Entomortierella beljakovae]|nr:hypothetical protein BGZ76_003555 [Entomortierella beljakovae]